uniref:Uncharacterized protein n=1 Tax=Neisseria meningitidis alpha522 TaxID=996307 RepID=I4E4B6_NEIME|nr:hypothetical protein NMALPHA522_0639 [Neisseria meningitidis alpha522]
MARDESTPAQVRAISVFPICTKPDKGQNGDLPAQCPQKNTSGGFEFQQI